MIAKKVIDKRYLDWNTKWGAPYGNEYSPRPSIFSTIPISSYIKKFSIFSNSIIGAKILGMFSFERNNRNRIFEYPWAFISAGLSSNMRIMEVGGSFSGFQFVVAKKVSETINVDPMDDRKKYKIYKHRFNLLNKAFKTNVKFIQSKISSVKYPDNYFDRIFCISVLEHLSVKERMDVVKSTYRLLKPAGLFIATIDLFLNLNPFSNKLKNRYGSNFSINNLVKESRMKLVYGKTSELFGFSDFDTVKIMGGLDKYLISSNYPILSQAFILQK